MAIEAVFFDLGGVILRTEHQAQTGGAEVLPPDARPDGLPGLAVPHDGRGPLVGDAHGVDRAGLGRGPPGHVQHRIGHGHGVELDQARGGRGGQDLTMVVGGDALLR